MHSWMLAMRLQECSLGGIGKSTHYVLCQTYRQCDTNLKTTH